MEKAPQVNTKIGHYLIKMMVFTILTLLFVAFLYPSLKSSFEANPALNGTILCIIIIGVGYSFKRVINLKPEIDWINAHNKRKAPIATSEAKARLLIPMSRMFEGREGKMFLSNASMRSILDAVISRLEESRSNAAYVNRLLIFLGLLGTFWGLLLTLGSVGNVISSLSVTSTAPDAILSGIKTNLQAPLDGMSKGFSSSLFGLGGSLIVSFLALQANQAQTRFYHDLEEWLSSLVRISNSTFDEDALKPLPGYIGALLQKTAEATDELTFILTKSEKSNISINNNIIELGERINLLTDHMKAEQSLLLKLAENQINLQQSTEKLTHITEDQSRDPNTKIQHHIQNIDGTLSLMAKQTEQGRSTFIHELRQELKLVARAVGGKQPLTETDLNQQQTAQQQDRRFGA